MTTLSFSGHKRSKLIMCSEEVPSTTSYFSVRDMYFTFYFMLLCNSIPLHCFLHWNQNYSSYAKNTPVTVCHYVRMYRFFTAGVYIATQFILDIHVHRYSIWQAECIVLFPSVYNVAQWVALAVRQYIHSLLQSDYLEVEQDTGVLAAALSAWPALKCHHHHTKRSLKCLLLLSSGFLFTALWKPHSPKPDNSSRCLGGVQTAAYSLLSGRIAPSQCPCFQSPSFTFFSPTPLSFLSLFLISLFHSFPLSPCLGNLC